MGMVIYRRITNIYEVPPEVLEQWAGKGLIPNSDNPNQVEINIGDGLIFTDQGKVALDVKVAFDGIPDECKTQIITNITDVNLTFEGRELILQKTLTDYAIKRNHAGILVDFLVGESRIEKQSVTFADCGYGGCGCGYGYGGYHISNRIGTEKFPNFYQK